MAVIEIDINELSGKLERVNIMAPTRVLRCIDRDAKAAGESRSGYIVKLALRGKK